jgi:hypothetical protein
MSVAFGRVFDTGFLAETRFTLIGFKHTSSTASILPSAMGEKTYFSYQSQEVKSPTPQKS